MIMNETDTDFEELLGDEELKIPINDKRRFNAEGERVAEDPEPKKEPASHHRIKQLSARQEIGTFDSRREMHNNCGAL